ncbi:MAG: hypothetical protein QG602_2539 [Verrucomicrobiota bacterium]|nr:hypothetical protein [Verrucomicrobiota bacterium]
MNKVTTIERLPDVAPADADSIMAVISRAASDPTVNVDKLERLLGMYERITSKQAEQAFNDAMTAVQMEMRPIAADANNPQTRSKYASYLALDKVMRPIYTKHGLSLSFNTADGASDGYVRVTCEVARGGYSRIYHTDMPADGKGAKGGDVMTKTHAVGSAVTYGQRYLLKMIFNIAVGEDDDGNRAGAGPLISADQVADLQALLEEVKADKAKFLDWLNVASLQEIPVRHYAPAVKALNDKRRGK